MSRRFPEQWRVRGNAVFDGWQSEKPHLHVIALIYGKMILLCPPFLFQIRYDVLPCCCFGLWTEKSNCLLYACFMVAL
ncbi:MAG TPA: hypothetical protein PLG17_09755, partial [Thermodesulfobacteriota bacterium]|nr:hypothetical protein [Thermodesulfobacteriota bacterium]